jgi:hypothetical protein
MGKLPRYGMMVIGALAMGIGAMVLGGCSTVSGGASTATGATPSATVPTESTGNGWSAIQREDCQRRVGEWIPSLQYCLGGRGTGGGGGQ